MFLSFKSWFSRPSLRLELGIALGSFGVFFLMIQEGHLVRGQLWGTLLMLGVTLMLGRRLGLFARALEFHETTAILVTRLSEEPRWMGPATTLPLALLALVLGCLVGGWTLLPWTLIGVLCILTLSAWRRPAWLVGVGTAWLYAPTLGAFGLLDCWETHYGEVAREILSRDDWISTWSHQETWFWSKPILIFWAEALCMGIFGVNFRPGAHPLHPEWALRLPHALFAWAAIMAVYALISRHWTRRAGVIVALVLATTPMVALVARQAITDMPLSACITIALCALGMVLAESDPTRAPHRYRVGPWLIGLRELVFSGLVLIVLPQILYLASRNITFVSGEGFAWHLDRFLYGSAGNSDMPGNPTEQWYGARRDGLFVQPIAQALYWSVGLVFALRYVARTTTASALYMVVFYVCCALALMAKGLPGIAIPGVVALLYLISSKRWDLLLSGRFTVARGCLIVPLVGLQWYTAMVMRHGSAFIQRIWIHDHLNRLTSGVHGDNGSVQYFIEQLGFAMFPWIALFPLVFVLWAKGFGQFKEAQRTVVKLFSLWAMGVFVLFSLMTTKFHHYILPAVPPLSVLLALGVYHAILETAEIISVRRLVFATAGMIGASAILSVAMAGVLGNIRGITPEDVPVSRATDWVLHHGLTWPWYTALFLLGLGLVFLSLKILGPAPQNQDLQDSVQSRLNWVQASAPWMIAVFWTLVITRDLASTTATSPIGNERLIQLFTYIYTRPWPKELDYRPVFAGLGLVFSLWCGFAIFPRTRLLGALGTMGLAAVLCCWSVNVYLRDTSKHWTQKHLIQTYYEMRRSPDEPLVAWQLNWLGEYFYTGNRIAEFVDIDNKKLKAWLPKMKGKRLFFIFDDFRLDTFKRLMAPHTVVELTDKRFNNKFMLVQVQYD